MAYFVDGNWHLQVFLERGELQKLLLLFIYLLSTNSR